MNANGALIGLALCASGLLACTPKNGDIVKNQEDIVKQLANIDERLTNIENRMEKGADGGAAQGDTSEQLADIDRRLTNIENRIEQSAARRRPRQPSPDQVYAVPIAGAPFKGREHAKITIVKTFEFACPFCLRVRPTIGQLLQDYGPDIKVVYKSYIVHPDTATIPAQAACAAHKQGKFTEIEPLIWQKGFMAGRNLSRKNMEKLAAEIGLNMKRFRADMRGDCVGIVQTDQRNMAKVGVRGTPAFFINGRFLPGAQPIQAFKTIIDEELQKANERIAQGTPVEKYYEEWVLKKGQKQL